ncbi:membrane protein insertion efficiency factor YidD [Patescibacteria group bacterium]|nr:MAG: membrane protein insertion efficiency factor YidD [Patescibacteria group bacterium]
MIFRFLTLKAIRLYQNTLSLDHGPLKYLFPGGFCRFYPSCSEYGYVCVERHGTLKGGFLAAWRIVRCNPFSAGGIDEPPEGRT